MKPNQARKLNAILKRAFKDFVPIPEYIPLPRVVAPSRKGGAHRTRRNDPARLAKHKKAVDRGHDE